MQTFRSLRRHRNYRLWFAGQLVSMTGTWIQNIAQAWFVLELTHSSAFAVGVLALFRFGPYALLGLLGGSLVDRLDYRLTIIATQTVMMVSAILLAILAVTGTANIVEVYGLGALTGLATVVDTPARQAFTVQMVGRDELSNAIALNSSMFNAARVLGPAIGGLLVASLGVAICFWLNAASFLAVIFALAVMRTQDFFAINRRKNVTLVRGAKDGLAYVWKTPVARLIILLMLVVATIGMNFQVWLPILANKTVHGDASTFGWLGAAFGLGAMTGALFVANIAQPRWNFLLGSAAGMSVSQLIVAPLNNVYAVAAALFAMGLTFALYTASSNTMLQLTVPDSMRGRVMAVYGYVFFGTAPLGGLLTGWLSDIGTTALYFFISGIVCLLATAVAIGFHHELRIAGLRLRRRRPTEPAAQSAIVER